MAIYFKNTKQLTELMGVLEKSIWRQGSLKPTPKSDLKNGPRKSLLALLYDRSPQLASPVLPWNQRSSSQVTAHTQLGPLGEPAWHHCFTPASEKDSRHFWLAESGYQQAGEMNRWNFIFCSRIQEVCQLLSGHKNDKYSLCSNT